MRRLFQRYEKFAIFHEREGRPVPIVGDAAIAAAAIGDGRLIPLIILDTTDRPDLDELIRVHEYLPPGDVDIQWAVLPGAVGKIALVLSFKRPIRVVAILEFDIVKEGFLIDQILRARILYLQSGRPGGRFVTNQNAPKIFVEVPDTGIRGQWDKLFHKYVAAHLKAQGLSRHQARSAARQTIREFRDFGQFRMMANKD
ncbi:MAG: hypothetical protein GY789_10850 [Hyphomicrobiales bacterium]|nr:hypothetical protein [Hyphomicrobiales bacterium]